MLAQRNPCLFTHAGLFAGIALSMSAIDVPATKVLGTAQHYKYFPLMFKRCAALPRNVSLTARAPGAAAAHARINTLLFACTPTPPASLTAFCVRTAGSPSPAAPRRCRRRWRQPALWPLLPQPLKAATAPSCYGPVLRC